MPLVLASNDANEADVNYADVTGVQYEYPRRYRALILEGERFVYYKGRRRPKGGTQRQGYFGTGQIGSIHQSKQRGGLLVCAISDYRPFYKLVYFKDEDGFPLEPGGERGGLHYQQGVRHVDETVFARILESGMAS